MLQSPPSRESNILISGESFPAVGEILTEPALQFLTNLHKKFGKTRETLLSARTERLERLHKGEAFTFLAETALIRNANWKVASPPDDLENRRVEITGPVERKMMINALNSGAKVFMADLEDALSPTWKNVIEGQKNLSEAVRRTLQFRDSESGKDYSLNSDIATLVVRPRGWHLIERHLRIDGAPISASLFDFGLYLFHNAKEALSRGTGPYYYLPKLESHLEARLWNEVIDYSEKELQLPAGSVRVTCLIETLPAAYEMEEILYELKNHIVALNAGRWDYLFSAIKKFRHRHDCIFPDRSQLTMTVPFMRAYTELLVHTCHKRGAHAIGGMAAFIPSRKDPKINETALAKVKEDKERESSDGFDGTWVAHPDLVPVAMEIFGKKLGEKPHQKDRVREDVSISAADLVNFEIPGAVVTEHGFRNNISVALQYLERWLAGVGAVGIFNLMEDAATAEISRAQLWQWLRHHARLPNGKECDSRYYRIVCDEETAKLQKETHKSFQAASHVLDALVLSPSFTEFLTVPAYELLRD